MMFSNIAITGKRSIENMKNEYNQVPGNPNKRIKISKYKFKRWVNSLEDMTINYDSIISQMQRNYEDMMAGLNVANLKISNLQSKNQELELRNIKTDNKNQELELRNIKTDDRIKELELRNIKTDDRIKELELRNIKTDNKNQELEFINIKTNDRIKELELRNIKTDDKNINKNVKYVKNIRNTKLHFINNNKNDDENKDENISGFLHYVSLLNLDKLIHLKNISKNDKKFLKLLNNSNFIEDIKNEISKDMKFTNSFKKYENNYLYLYDGYLKNHQ